MLFTGLQARADQADVKRAQSPDVNTEAAGGDSASHMQVGSVLCKGYCTYTEHCDPLPALCLKLRYSKTALQSQ